MKDTKALLKRLVQQGWTITVTGGNHLKCVSPTGRPVFISSTPSDHRTLKNQIRDLRRAGADL